MKRVYPHEVAMVEYVRYLEAGGRKDFEEWYFLRLEHREMLLTPTAWPDEPDEADTRLARMSELEALLGY